MNYISQIKGFWVAQDAHSFSAEEVGLYFYLVEISNKLNWMNPFKRNNSKIMADLGIKSHKTLSKHRNRLQQAGIITVTTRNGDSNVSYKIADLSKNYQGLGVGLGVGSGVGLGVGSGVDKENKNRKPKPNNSEGKPSGEKVSSGKNASKEVADHWQPMVDTWFTFYSEGPGKGEKPTFEGQAPKSLKKIAGWLEKRSIAKGYEWTEQTAVDTLKKFLHYAYSLPWIRENFLLPNLERQYDKITNQNANPNNKQTATSSLKQRLAAEIAGNQGQG